MASATAFDSLAFVAAALSALTEKHIVTKIEYDRISIEVKSGKNKVYVCAGKVNVVEEIKQTYAQTAQLVSQRYYLNTIQVFENADINISDKNKLWELRDYIDEKKSAINPTEGKQRKKWFSGLCCLGNCSNSPRLAESNRYKLVQDQEKLVREYEPGEIQGVYQSNIESMITDQSTSDTKASRRVQRTAKTIDLFVILPSGKTITIEMESTHSLVTNIKYKIKERVGIAVTEQVLHFGGHLLEDGKSLNEYKIKANSTIHLSVKGRGGAKKRLFYIDSKYLDPQWDYDFTNISDGSQQFTRGGYPYYRPCGWNRIAIKVLGKYQNDIWLGQTGDGSKGEWAVTYHGTNSYVFNNIANEGYIVGNGDAFGRGVYSTPKIDKAARYASPFNYDGINYIGVFQNRVNPRGVNITNIMEDVDYWVCPNKNDIRPYGLCVKKV